MPSLSDRFRSLRSFWEGINKSSSSQTQSNGSTENNKKFDNMSHNLRASRRKKEETFKALAAANSTSSTKYQNIDSEPSTSKYASVGSVKNRVKLFEKHTMELSINDLTADDENFSADGTIRTSCMSKAERAEVYLRTQEEKLQRQERFQSVFYERVDLHAHTLLQNKADLHLLQDEDSDRSSDFTVRVTGNGGPSRTLWRHMSEVTNDGLLNCLTKKEVDIQEAQFEIITSEASYFKNLQLIMTHFYKNPKFDDQNKEVAVLSSLHKHHLFSNIIDIYDCSSNFLKRLESLWKESPRLDSICKIILETLPSFAVYPTYCRNFYYQTNTLQLLKENPAFTEVLRELERNPICRFGTLQSFLELPMKRMLSLRLLLEKLADKMEEKDKRCEVTVKALGALMKLTKDCDQESRMMSEKENMLMIWQSLQFSKVKKIETDPKRKLVKEGQIRVINAIPNLHGFLSKIPLVKSYIKIYMFSDIIILARQKNNNVFQVLKHCKRTFVDADQIGRPDQLQMQMNIVDDSDGSQQVSLVLQMDSMQELDRWLNIFKPTDEAGEYIYDVSDCPQFEVVTAYHSEQKDDLELEVGDLINVYKKTQSGWYLGSKTDDPNDFRGWFPKEHVKENQTEHAVARIRKISFRRKLAMKDYYHKGT